MKRRRTVVVSSLVLLCFSVIASGVFYILASNQAAAFTLQVTQLQTQLTSDQITVQQLSVRLPKKGADAVIPLVPQTPDQPGLLREFQAMAQETQVSISSVTFAGAGSGSGSSALGATQSVGSSIGQTGSQPTGNSQLQVSLQLQGSEQALLNFTHVIQSNRRLVGVTSAALTTTQGNIQLSLNLTFPYKA